MHNHASLAYTSGRNPDNLTAAQILEEMQKHIIPNALIVPALLAKKTRDVTRLKSWTNTVMAETWEEKGVTVRAANFNPADCTLDMRDLESKTTSKTKLVAVGYASNAVGTINDVAEVVRLAKRVGALSYIDAVHYATSASRSI